MSYQFKHVSTYSRTASKGSSAGWSAQDIADEAERKPSACHHVKAPIAPTLLFGVMPSQAVKRAHAWAEQAKDVRGSKLRQDGLCIVAGVISAPEEFEHWDAYKKACIENLSELHGDRLLSVIEHTDEAYPHMHFYIVPRDGETMDDIHVGLKARNAVKYAKKPTGEQNLAYNAAMQQFQTDHYEQVAKGFGLLRDGPKREHLSRPEWKAQKAAAKLTATRMQETEAKCQALTLAALEASASQTAAERVDALAKLKTEMETLRANNARDCEADTKVKLDQAKMETQAAAIKLAEARKEKDEAARKLAEAEQKLAEAEQKLAGADKVANATEAEVARKLAEAEAEIDADRQIYKANRAAYVAKARQEGYAEGVAAGTPDAVKELKTELQKADERTTRNYNLAVEQQRRAAVWEQSDKQKSSEISVLKTKLQALTPAPQHNTSAQSVAPSPRF